MAHPAKQFLTPAAYLEMEVNLPEKHEYFSGEMARMDGAGMINDVIIANITGELHPFLKGTKCMEYPSGVRVTTPLSDAYMYPDITIVCGDYEPEDDRFDTVTNPSVIIEVMNMSTAKGHKGYNFFRYIRIPSLQEYIIVDTNKYSITTARKQSKGNCQNNFGKFKKLFFFYARRKSRE